MATANLGLSTSTPGVDTDSDAATREQVNVNLLDLHDHTTGKGVKVPTGGLNINADLSFGSNSATSVKSTVFTSQASDLLVTNTLFVKNNELYYVDAALNVVQITSSGAVSIASLVSGNVLLDGGNTRGANLRVGSNDNYSMIIETNNTDRFSVDGDGLGRFIFDFAITRGAANSSTGTLNNVSTSQKSYFQFTGASATTVTGFANGTDGKVILLTNKTGSQLTINNNDSGSLAANRILTGTGSSLSVENNASVMVIYDSNTSLWNIVGGTGGASTGKPVYTIDLASGSLYNDSAAAPVDGTGGTTTGMTYAAVTSGTLRGAISYKLSKDAANRQGNGVAFTLTIDSVDQSTVQSVQFDISSSANFVSGDADLYIYDATNATMLPKVSVLPTGTQAQFSRAIALTTGTSYKILLHVASTSALAYDITLDAMSVDSTIRPQVAGISDVISYTPSISGGFGTLSAISGYYKRIGDEVEAWGQFTYGSSSAALGTISLPTGLTISTGTKIANTTTAQNSQLVGFIDQAASTTGSLVSLIACPATSNTVVYIGGQQATSTVHTRAQNVSTSMSGATTVSFRFKVPVTQWSSSITLSSTNSSIEYASNSSATDADDTTSFVSGSTGSVGIMGTTLTGIRKKRVQFPTPSQPTDRLQLELLDTTVTNASWIPVSNGTTFFRSAANRSISNYMVGSGYSIGIGLLPISSTQYDVMFGQIGSTDGSTFGASNGTGWATFNNIKWRVARYSSIGAAELAPATITSQGTVGYSPWVASGLVAANFTSFGTPTSIDIRMRREGDSLRLAGVFTLGTASGVVSSLALPTLNGVALSINTTKIFNSTATSGQPGYMCGRYVCNTVGTPVPYGVMTLNAGTSSTLMYFGRPQTTTTNSYLTPSASGGNLGSSGDTVQFDVLIPISGWE